MEQGKYQEVRSFLGESYKSLAFSFMLIDDNIQVRDTCCVNLIERSPEKKNSSEIDQLCGTGDNQAHLWTITPIVIDERIIGPNM